MRKQMVSSQEQIFLDWLRSLRPDSQETVYQGVVTGMLPQALASIPGEELHGALEITPPIGFEDDSLFVGEFDFFDNVVASTS